MELIFETSDGDDDGINQFPMEVSNSDSVPQIKQKIQELKGFPISTQTLRFNGAVLPDDFNLRHSPIVDGSTIHLHLRQHIDAAEAPSQLYQSEDFLQELDKILRDWDLLPSPPRSDQTPIAAAGNQPPTTIDQQSPIHPAGDADNDRSLTAYETIRTHNIRPLVRLPGPPPPTLMVWVIYGGQQTTVMVRPEEAVSALRGRLQQIEWTLPERYEFIYNHAAMDETRSFAFHHVHQGDVIRTAPRSP